MNPSLHVPELRGEAPLLGGGAIEDVDIPPEVAGEMVAVAGGAAYSAYLPLSGENPLFVHVRSNWQRVQSAWSIQAWKARRELKSAWESLEERQRSLRAQAADFDAGWTRLRIEVRAEEFKRSYAVWEHDSDGWRHEAQAYESNCMGKVGSSSCQREYERLTAAWQRISDRFENLRQIWDSVAEDIKAFYKPIESYSAQGREWQRDLVEFNDKIRHVAQARTPEKQLSRGYTCSQDTGDPGRPPHITIKDRRGNVVAIVFPPNSGRPTIGQAPADIIDEAIEQCGRGQFGNF